MNYYYLS